MWSLVVTGGAIVIIAACILPVQDLDNRFLVLCLMAMASSIVAIKIPRVSGRITVADTFVFLAMLLYGAPAAEVGAVLDGGAATLIISTRPRTVLFNSAILAISTCLTAAALEWTMGSSVNVIDKGYSEKFFLAVCVMALVQYVANTSLIAVEKASKIK